MTYLTLRIYCPPAVVGSTVKSRRQRAKILHGVNAFVIAVRKPIIHTKIKFVFDYGRVGA